MTLPAMHRRQCMAVLYVLLMGVCGCDSNPSKDFAYPGMEITKDYVGKLHGDAICLGRSDATMDELKSWYDERMREFQMVSSWSQYAVTGEKGEWRVPPKATVTIMLTDLAEYRTIGISYSPDG